MRGKAAARVRVSAFESLFGRALRTRVFIARLAVDAIPSHFVGVGVRAGFVCVLMCLFLCLLAVLCLCSVRPALGVSGKASIFERMEAFKTIVVISMQCVAVSESNS